MAAKKTPKLADLTASVSAKIMQSTVTGTVPLPQKTAATRAKHSLMLQYGLVSVAIKLYKATDQERVEFNNIHVPLPDASGKPQVCGQRLGQRQWCDACQREVTRDEMASGFSLGDGRYIAVSKDDKASCETMDDGLLEITEFCAANSVDSIYFDDIDFVGAGGTKSGEKQVAERGLAILRAAMLRQKVVAIGHYVKGGREYHVMLRPYAAGGLVLHYLHYEYEIRSFETSSVQADASVVPLACELIESMTVPFDMSQKRDMYLYNLRQLIAKKASGEQPQAASRRSARPVSDDLMSAFKSSIVAAKAAKAGKR